MLFVLDRDGVINFESTAYIKTPDEWIPIPGSIDAVARLSKANQKIVIATNQAGVGRGLFTEVMLKKIHQKMIALIEAAGGKIEKIYCCPHHPDEKCRCRKPEPGLLEQVMRDFQIKSDEMVFIGDSLKDWGASEKVGCQFVLVKTGYGLQALETVSQHKNQLVFEDLAGAVEYFVGM